MHLLWQTFDREHPAYKPETKLPFDNIFLDLYRRLDAWIGRFMEKAPNSSVIVFSGSGLGPNYSGWHLLPAVLEKLEIGPAAGERSPSKLSALLPIRRWGSYKIRKIEDTLSVSVIEFLKKAVPATIWDKATRRILYAGSGWDESRAFCLPNDYSGAIRINLQGREPRGIVGPGREYEALCEEITAELKALINPATGRPAVSEVLNLGMVYPNESLGDFPDLVVIWANDAPITSLTSPRIGTLRGDFPERRSGAHRNDCFLISSETILPRSPPSRPPDIVDIAPTIFELLSVQCLPRFDGHPLLHRQ
jgi:predicted AlkP superfamily phosphohydrolase/phosphomutase